jgi:succinate-semialdehyde dehydrogenase/glutarate-semialdehyde dehydrogenase
MTIAPPSPTVRAVATLAADVATVAERPALAVENAMTAGLLGEVPHCTAEDVAEAARRARAAQAGWAARPVAERAAVLTRLHDLVLDRQDEALDLIQLENGKARRHAFEEVLDVALTARYYANTAEEYLRPKRRQGVQLALTEVWEHHHPKGLVGVISPWNYPLTLGISDALPALVAGNAVLAKPDEHTPFSALWAVRLLEEAGMPRGLVQVVTGPGAELGTPLIDQVDFVMFTGSTGSGGSSPRRPPSGLIDFSMELGGKNALLVLDDADVGKAVTGRGARGLLEHRAAVHLDRADVRPGAAVGRVHVALRGRDAAARSSRPRWTTAPGWARSSPTSSSRRCATTSTTRWPRARRC